MAAAVTYFAAHAMYLSPSLEDIDSINFALGLEEFDPAKHQPHPPGSPVYVAVGRLVLALVSVFRPTLDHVAAEALALGVGSLIGGVVVIVAAARLYTLVAPDRTSLVGWAVALLAAVPLFWLAGLRPMSDLPGLSVALVAQVLILEGRTDRRRLVWGALASGLAAGVRLQTVWLTIPLLAVSLLRQRAAGPKWLLTRPVAALAAGGLVWVVPLLAVSGGLAGYLRVLGSQAGEDFAWVDMLWSNPTPRRLAFALYETFVLPWGWNPLAVAIAAAAGVGGCVALARDRGTLAMLSVAFGPYVVFHLLFQETVTVRYALPTLVPVAWLVARSVSSAGRFGAPLAASLLTAALVVSVPVGVAYGSEVHPAFRAAADLTERVASERPAAIYSHYSLWRALQTQPRLGATEPHRQYEWLGPADYWKRGGTAPIWFLANPRRTDLALIAPRALKPVHRYDWAVADRHELSGARPRRAVWYEISPPGWFAGEGWSLTPETGGLAAATGTGPDARPIEAWVRRRPGPHHLVIGGRHLGHAGDPDAEFELSVDDQVVDRWRLTAEEQNFLRFLDLPGGVAEGPGAYARLTVSAYAPGGSLGRAPVSIRQFDIRPSDRPVWGFGEGWHEVGLDTRTGVMWRWTSERSILRTKGFSTALTLSLRGRSPLEYLGVVPTVRITVGGRLLEQFQPDSDFTWTVTVPVDDLNRAAGAIAIETAPVYFPGPSEGTDDDRHLGLQLYETRIDPVRP